MGIFAMEKLNGLCTFIEISEPDLSDDEIDCKIDASTVEGNSGGDMYPECHVLCVEITVRNNAIIVDSKILTIHSKIFSIFSLVKISIT